MNCIKYAVITVISAVTGCTIVNLLGSTYVVGDNFVRKIR